MAEGENKPFKVITIRSWYPASSQYVPIRDNTGLGRNLDLLSTWPHIERMEYNRRTEAGQFEERANELLTKLNFDSRHYNPNLTFILSTWEELISRYTNNPYYKTTNKIHG